MSDTPTNANNPLRLEIQAGKYPSGSSGRCAFSPVLVNRSGVFHDRVAEESASRGSDAPSRTVSPDSGERGANS